MRIRPSVFVLALLLAPSALAQLGPVSLRYRLQSGDRYVYRQVFEREVRDGSDVIRTRLVTLNHLVVLSRSGDRATVGVQRNRQSAELLEYRERGKDKLSRELPNFEERMAKRPSAFADANLFTATGMPLLPVQAVREGNSEILYAVTELPILGQAKVQAGSEWTDEQLERRMRVSRFTDNGCAAIEGVTPPAGSHVNYVFCPLDGLVRRLEFEGEYPGFGRTIFHEKVSLELLQLHSGENEAEWLADAQTQRAVLAAYLLPGAAKPDAARITALLRSSTSPDIQTLALSVMLRHGMSLSADTSAALETSNDARVRRIAAMFGRAADPPGVTVCGSGAPRRSTAQKFGTTLRGMKDPRFAGQPYMMRVPPEYSGDEPFPLIVYLSGGPGKAFAAALTAEDALRSSDYLALYPQARDLWWEPQSTVMFPALLDEVLREFNVDTNRVYLAGFSNGGTAAFYYGTLWPQRFAAIASLMGTGVKSPASADELPARNLQGVPLLLVHGDRDDIIPYAASTYTYDEMKRVHPRVIPELHVLKNRGHDVTLQSDDGLTLPFLERFRREPFPRDIAAHFTDPKYGRHYWVEVTAMSGNTADVEGHIRDGNTIELKTHGVKTLRGLLRPELVPAAGPVRIIVNGKERYVGELKNDCGTFERSREMYADPVLAFTNEIEVDLQR